MPPDIASPAPRLTGSGPPAAGDTRPSSFIVVNEIAGCTEDSSPPTSKPFVVPPWLTGITSVSLTELATGSCLIVGIPEPRRADAPPAPQAQAANATQARPIGT